MKRKNISFLVPLALGALVLTSCGEEEHIFVNPLDENGFFKTYSYSQNANEDGILANFSNEDPGSYDDTVNLDKFIFAGEELAPNITSSKVVIPSTIREDVANTNGGYKIVSLGESFMKDSTRSEVVLPTYLERIEASAFENTKSLSNLKITDLKNLNYVGSYAFKDNAWYNTYYESLKDGPVIFGNTLYAYKGKVTSYTVPANIKNIAADAFKGHTELTSVTFSEGLEEIGESAFEGTKLVSVNLPSSLVKLDSRAFASLPLTSVTISAPKANREYGYDIFKDSNSIESLTYDGTVALAQLGLGIDKLTSVKLNGENVVDNALATGTNIRSLDLKGVKYIGANNLGTLVDLETITDADSLEFIRDDGLVETKYYKSLSDGPVYLGKYFQGFKGAKTNITLKSDLAGIAKGALNGYEGELETLPASLKYIGDEAFKGVQTLKKIILPNSIEIGNNAFDGCIRVTEIDVKDYTKLGNKAFKGCNKAKKLALPYADDISELFGDYIEIESYTFRRGPKAIATAMFEGITSLVEVVLSDTIEDIGPKAFRKCSTLQSIKFPVSVKNVKAFAFQGCTSLKKVEFETAKDFNRESNKVFYRGVREIGPFCFDACKNLGPTFELPFSIRKVNGCFVAKTGVTSIKVNVLDYYLDGITDLSGMNLTKDQDWIEFSNDWNVNYEKQDQYGNPYTIPYTYEIISTK